MAPPGARAVRSTGAGAPVTKPSHRRRRAVDRPPLLLDTLRSPRGGARMNKRHLFRVSLVVSGLSLALYGAAFAAKAKDAKGKGKDAKAVEDPVARGRYLVSFAGCNDCHTPWVFNKDLGMPVPDHTRYLSGHPAGGPEPQGKVDPRTDLAFIGATFTAFKLPFGTVYSANLTPDKETGLGNWNEEMFLGVF